MSRPNLLFVMTDQQRSTALGCAGVEAVQTPSLDALAAEGARFTNAISNVPACTPARATLLTGRYPLTHGLVQNDLPIDATIPTLGTALRDAGYACGYIGKLHIDGRGRGAFIPPGPRRLGFEAFWAGTECNHSYFQGYYYKEDGEVAWFDCYEPDGQTELAIDFIKRRGQADEPFCLVVSWSPPHCPYRQAPRRYLDMYPPASIELMPTARDAGIDHHPELEPAAADRRKRETIAGYYAHCTALDACMQRLLDCLDDQGLAEETIVVYTSDHGDMLFSQNQGWKAKPWRESAGIPLIMRWPGHIDSGRVSNAPIGLVDLMPSLLALTGTPIPDGVEGRNLSAWLLGDESAAPDDAYILFPCMNGRWTLPAWRGVVTATHTYAATPDGPWLLYDDRADPFQQHNLIDDPASAQIRAKLQSRLDAYLQATGDDFAPAIEMADRYMPCHDRCQRADEPPLEPIIAKGQAARANRSY